MNSPDQTYEQEEPEKKKGCMGLGWGCWIGMGCLTILLVCGGGGGAFFYFGYRVGLVPVLEEGVKLAKENKEVQREMGVPIEYTIAGMQSSPNFSGIADYTYSISGPKATGTLHIRAMLQGPQIRVLEATVNVNGKTIDVTKSSFELKDTTNRKLDVPVEKEPDL